jgi:hypothetical protein
METSSTKPKFKTKPNRKRIIGSVPLFKTEFETGTDVSAMHSWYIENVLKRKVSYVPAFGVYQNDTDGSFKRGRSKYKCNEKTYL